MPMRLMCKYFKNNYWNDYWNDYWYCFVNAKYYYYFIRFYKTKYLWFIKSIIKSINRLIVLIACENICLRRLCFDFSIKNGKWESAGCNYIINYVQTRQLNSFGNIAYNVETLTKNCTSYENIMGCTFQMPFNIVWNFIWTILIVLIAPFNNILNQRCTEHTNNTLVFICWFPHLKSTIIIIVTNEPKGHQQTCNNLHTQFNLLTHK